MIRVALRSLFLAVAALAIAASDAASDTAAPVYRVRLPMDYRSWELIAPAVEAAPLDELRVVLGNSVAVEAARAGTLPYPDGAVLVKLAWKRVPSAEFAPASVPGDATTVQVMVKNSARYTSSGGWGFGRFVAGKPADLAQHETCLPCHRERVPDNDLVFTRYAP
ncbi:MAG: cytochrome P460 family protein [Polyangiales bacterium]